MCVFTNRTTQKKKRQRKMLPLNKSRLKRKNKLKAERVADENSGIQKIQYE